MTKEELDKIFDFLIERGYQVSPDYDMGICGISNELGDIFYCGAIPKNELFARELYEHLKIAHNIFHQEKKKG